MNYLCNQITKKYMLTTNYTTSFNFKIVQRMLIILMVLGLGICLTFCSKDDDENKEEQQLPEVNQSATQQVMVLFAPGELGDNGFADNVLKGVVKTQQANKDSLNLQFISLFDLSDTQDALQNWAKPQQDSANKNTYKRRLLVIANPIMVRCLDVIKDDLSTIDEVLLLKVNEDDVKQVAETYGLGNRVHGLNISAAKSARDFYRVLLEYAYWTPYVLGRPVTYDTIPVYRLHSENQLIYRDSLIETLTELLPSTTFNFRVLSEDLKGGGQSQEKLNEIYSLENTLAFQGDAWEAAFLCGRSYDFAIVDLGVFNSGWDYCLQGESYSDAFISLILDAESESPFANRWTIQRAFDVALYNWINDWMQQAIGDMPRMTQYSNGELCSGNLPDFGF